MYIKITYSTCHLHHTNAAFSLARCIATLMVIFVQLRKRHLPQREGQAVSNFLPINLYSCRFARSGRSQTVLFNFEAMPCGEKARAAWLLRAATLKQQAVIRWWNGNAASCRRAWNQLNNIKWDFRCSKSGTQSFYFATVSGKKLHLLEQILSCFYL